MDQSGTGILNCRGFASVLPDIDVNRFRDKNKSIFYRLRCQYRGNEADGLADNEPVRFRQGARYRRFTFED